MGGELFTRSVPARVVAAEGDTIVVRDSVWTPEPAGAGGGGSATVFAVARCAGLNIPLDRTAEAGSTVAKPTDPDGNDDLPLSEIVAQSGGFAIDGRSLAVPETGIYQVEFWCTYIVDAQVPLTEAGAEWLCDIHDNPDWNADLSVRGSSGLVGDGTEGTYVTALGNCFFEVTGIEDPVAFATRLTVFGAEIDAVEDVTIGIVTNDGFSAAFPYLKLTKVGDLP